MGNMKGTAHPVRQNSGQPKAKLIHLRQHTFKILSKEAIDRDMNLKNFIENYLNMLAIQLEKSEEKSN